MLWLPPARALVVHEKVPVELAAYIVSRVCAANPRASVAFHWAALERQVSRRRSARAG